MSKATKGDTVRVHYTGKLTDGTVFDSSREREPLEFTLGEGQLIPGFESAVDGLAVGDSVETTITADDAYGPYNDNLVQTVDRQRLPDDLNPSVGQQLQVQQQDGSQVVVTVSDVNDATITLDANHPLAGKELVFDIELMEIVTG